MIPLRVRHRTTYRYRRAVDLGPHRLMLRPRESRDLQVITLVVGVSPTSTVTWAHDVFGNAVATAVFKEPSDSLVIDSVVELRLEGTAWPIFNIAVSAIEYPFRYSNDELTDLGALLKQQYPDPTRRLANWARAFILGERTDTLSLLKDLTSGVSGWIRYESRDDEGVQSPIETLDRGVGSCRISPCSLSKQRVAWVSAPGWSQAIFSTPIGRLRVRRTLDQPTPGPKFSYRAPGGLASIRQIAALAARTLFPSLSRATFGRRRRWPEPMREASTLLCKCPWRSL